MRKDMSKVVTERPRYGDDGSLTRRHVRRAQRAALRSYVDEDDNVFETFSKMRFDHGVHGNKKSFSDLIGPLRRFLRSRVGRPWDEVYSEICQNLKADTVTGAHIRQHVAWEVEQHAVMKDGEVWVNNFRWTSKVQGLYVHPETGILSYAPKKKEKKKLTYNDRVWVENRLFVIKSGVWFEAFLKEIPSDFWNVHPVPTFSGYRYERRSRYVCDVLTKELVWLVHHDNTFMRERIVAAQGNKYGNPFLYCYKLLQLNSRVIHQLKLNEKLAELTEESSV